MARLRVILEMAVYGGLYGALAGALSGAIIGFFAFIIGALFGLVAGAVQGLQIGIVVGLFAGLITYLINPSSHNAKFYRLVMAFGCTALTAVLTFIKAQDNFNTKNGDFTLVLIVSLIAVLMAVLISQKMSTTYLKSHP